MSDFENKDEIVQVDYVELDKITYYTAVQVAEEIQEPVSTVRSWAGKDFGDVLDIERENGRRRFTKEDIKRLKFIKGLRKANMSINQIKEYINKNGFKYANYDSGLVDIKDPLGFQALATALSVEVDTKLNMFMEKLVNQVGEINKRQLEFISQELNESLLETLDEKFIEFNSNTSKANEEVAISMDEKFDSLKEQLEDIKQEVKVATVSLESIKEFENPKTLISRITNLFSKR